MPLYTALCTGRLFGRLAASRAKDREKSRVKEEDERELDVATTIKQQGKKKEEYTRRKRHYTRTYLHTRRAQRTYINYIAQIYSCMYSRYQGTPKNSPGERDDKAVFWSLFYAVGHLDNDNVVTEQPNRRILRAKPFHTFSFRPHKKKMWPVYYKQPSSGQNRKRKSLLFPSPASVKTHIILTLSQS